MMEFNIGMLWQRLVRGWKTPVVLAIVGGLYALSTLPGSKPVYSVHMLIVPAPNDQTSVPTAGSALSTLLGIGGGGGANFTRYENLIGSNVVAQRLQDKYNMIYYAFRSSWDAKNHKWIESHSLRGDLTVPLLRFAGLPTGASPDVTALAGFLKLKIKVLPSTLTDIVDVSMDDPDVAYATRILLLTHEQANAVLRDQIASRARQQVDYLQRKLAQTTVQDYRQTLLTLLSQQEKTLMLTQTDASYAAEIISPPMASPTPVAPRPVLTLFVAILVGGIIGSGIVIFFGPSWWRELYLWSCRQYDARFGLRVGRRSVVR